MVTPHDPKQNHLLAALPPSEFERLAPHLELVTLKLGEVLYESGGQLKHVYFPTNSIVSLLYVMEDGASAEIAVVGNEGILGISLFMGGETTPSRAVVQSEGVGYRLQAQSPETGIQSRRPDDAFVTALYPGTHNTDVTDCCLQSAPFCRSAAMPLVTAESRPSVLGSELTMTQELIANMLGVRREGVTEAAGKLRDAGIIEYSRGRIKVLDRRQIGGVTFASVMPWSRKNSIGCFRTSHQAEAFRSIA